MSKNSTTLNPAHSPREHVIEHIYERLRDADRTGDLYQDAIDLLGWIEERALGRDDSDGRLKFVNRDHPVEFL
jgi:hypothetical protein